MSHNQIAFLCLHCVITKNILCQKKMDKNRFPGFSEANINMHQRCTNSKAGQKAGNQESVQRPCINQSDFSNIPWGYALWHIASRCWNWTLNSKRLAERKKWKNWSVVSYRRELFYLHLDKCLVPSIWTGSLEGKWIGGGGKSVDDEYSNLVGHYCLPFFSTHLQGASCAWERGCV